MDDREREGRFTVGEIEKLFELFAKISDKTRLSTADQAKLDAIKSKLDSNDQAVADALKP